MAHSWEGAWSGGTWSQWRWWGDEAENKWQDADDGQSSAWYLNDVGPTASTYTSARKKLACSWCKEEHACQYLYLLYIGDLQGGMSCLCYNCWMESEEHGKGTQTTTDEFKKLRLRSGQSARRSPERMPAS